MTTQISVEPFNTSDNHRRCDALFVALGYEERSRFVASTGAWNADRSVAWAFDANRSHSFCENEQWFVARNFEIVPQSRGNPRQWIDELCQSASSDQEVPLTLAVDISSLTRERIALWIKACETGAVRRPISVDFLYSIAQYVEPVEHDGVIVTAGPVLPTFAGWADDPGMPAILVLGLGYERDKAIGAVEYIEPAEVFAFDPSVEGSSYAIAVTRANEQLWKMRPRPPTRILYDPEQPFSTFVTIEGLVASLVRRARPVIVPFGPKIFSLCAMLASRFHPSCAVWRVSSGDYAPPVERRATGLVVGVTVKFSHKLL